MPEDYVRPPLLAEERAPRRRRWSFRLVFGLIIVGLVVGLVFLVRALTASNGEGSPGVTNGAAAVHPRGL